MWNRSEPDQCVFDEYNKRGKEERPPLQFDDDQMKARIADFKKRHIYDHIAQQVPITYT